MIRLLKFLTLTIFLIFISCEKENDNPTVSKREASLPEVTTANPMSITQTTATLGGIIVSDGDTVIIENGIYWGKQPDPFANGTKVVLEVADNYYYYTQIENLADTTTYYVVAYATNSLGTAFGEEINFSTKSYKLPKLIFKRDKSYTYYAIPLEAEVTDNGGSEITERGFFVDTLPDPELKGTKIQLGSGVGAFSYSLVDFELNHTYYIKAYATNRAGTALSEENKFRIYMNIPGLDLVDTDGNIYPTVYIGEQLWQGADMEVTSYTDGTPIVMVNGQEWETSSGPYMLEYVDYYGGLYNNLVLHQDKGVCPSGWHIPSGTEWLKLIDYLGGAATAGGKLKEAGTEHWREPNTGGTNESGFKSIGRGLVSFDGSGIVPGNTSVYWTSEEFNNWENLLKVTLYYDTEEIDLGYTGTVHQGYSLRCLAD